MYKNMLFIDLHSNLVIFKFALLLDYQLFQLNLHSNLVIFKLILIQHGSSYVILFTFQSGDIQIDY